MATRYAALIGILTLLMAATAPAVTTAQGGETAYAGEHSGGGEIRFTVSADGLRITSLEITNVPGDACRWDSVRLDNWGTGLPIVDNGFAASNADGDELIGAFPALHRAEGRFRIQDPRAPCRSETVTWTARGTPAAAPPPAASARPPGQEQAVAPAPARAVSTTNPEGGPSKPRGPAARAYCGPGETPRFESGLADLRDRLGDVMGSPVECPHPNYANGDILQGTSAGLAYVRWATGVPTFTDGWRHWALTTEGTAFWEGESPDPPR